MAVGIINEIAKCTNCTFADSWGRSCKFSLMQPLAVWLSGKPCPDFKRKTSEQIEQQIIDLKLEKK